MEYNVYCDETNHLQHSSRFMALGALWGPKEHIKDVSKKIRGLKIEHGLKPGFEIKWTKVSGSERFLDFYKKLLDVFFLDNKLNFRVIIIDKKNLDHISFKQNHDQWYYKMYFLLIPRILNSDNNYNIYLDIKDTRSNQRTQHLKGIICNALGNESIINRMQLVSSFQVLPVQLVDLMIGLIQYKYNSSNTTGTKSKLLKHFESHYNIDLTKNTCASERKFNVFHWEGKNV